MEFLGKHEGFTLCRQGPGGGPIDDPPAGPLKVLLFTSLPGDLDAEKERLNTEAEQENVIDALDPWVREGRAELTCPDDGGFTAFRDLVKREEYHLVCLSRHGTYQDNSLEGSPAPFLYSRARTAGPTPGRSMKSRRRSWAPASGAWRCPPARPGIRRANW